MIELAEGAGPLAIQGALFASAFLSATLLPGSSEAMLVALILRGGFDPVVLTLVATLGNTLGSLFNWACGRWLMHRSGARWFPVSERGLGRARAWFARFGLPTLLFAWLPVVGDALTLVAGVLGVRWLPFLLLVGAGKLLRYGAVAAAATGFLAW
ncbi:DedA family protein [Aureimonas flava]|uniref:DedA family protein n=1 Tax=Aureimonas flava TaxID=2320271 RepID=A0A3A1WRW2_9HYPH|nr:YqaA family protein [Aureimonas flava]RIY00898.1 DedA family protein [Aureimonas flava]